LAFDAAPFFLSFCVPRLLVLAPSCLPPGLLVGARLLVCPFRACLFACCLRAFLCLSCSRGFLCVLVLVSCRPFVFCLFFFWFFGRAFGAFSFSFLSGLYCLVAGLFPFTFSPRSPLGVWGRVLLPAFSLLPFPPFPAFPWPVWPFGGWGLGLGFVAGPLVLFLFLFFLAFTV